MSEIDDSNSGDRKSSTNPIILTLIAAFTLISMCCIFSSLAIILSFLSNPPW